jgi:CheY-like chemotaxis protein
MVNRHFHIVVADDDKDDQFLLEEALKLSNISCEIKCFYNGSSVLEYLEIGVILKKQILPDLIILDINMPHVNGIEVLRAIKSDFILGEIPVYMLSTTKETAARTNCLGLGALDFYTKPSEMNQLKVIIDDIFASLPS